MGNSESQYSIDGPKGTSFIFPKKQKPYSQKLNSTKDDVLSPHMWWKNASPGSGYKARCVGPRCLSPPKSRLSFSAQHCDFVSKRATGAASEHRWYRSPGCGLRRRHESDDYEENPYGAALNGLALKGHSDDHEVLEEQSSPRVVIKKDGTLRVEFTNTSGNTLLLDEASGPVQLLKFSPKLESASNPSLPGSSGSRQEVHRSGPPPASTSSTARTSKGSSLSSEGSWYDSPWGPSTELVEQDQPCSASRTLANSPIHQLDTFTEQSTSESITNLYRDSAMAATFPTTSDLLQLQQPMMGQKAHRASFASIMDMESLFGSLPEMLDFQRVFLQTLEERIASSPDFSTLETPSQFKLRVKTTPCLFYLLQKLLFSLGGSFLYYADHFKLYSGFCANHIKVQQVLKRAKTDQAFKEFLDARNPTKQHSSTLESYLIKPVQRVLKYPLLLRELVSLTDADSEEHYHLTEALKAMEKVASHINEMQKIYEEYGSVFDQLVAEQTGLNKEVTEISMGEFLMHSSAVWLNPHPSLGRMRKDPELTVFVFRKAVILVYRENNKLKKKTNPRSALCHGDSDPFKFRRLIPLSSLQVRLGNAAGTGAESSCIWELIHSRSEVEGRPETVFQLCSSVSENKISIIKVIRSLLRENLRRNLRKEGTSERNKERLTPACRTLPSSAKLASSRALRLCKQPFDEVSSQGGTLKLGPDSDEGSLSSGTYSFSGAPPACPLSDPHVILAQQNWAPPRGSDSNSLSTSVKESDILNDEDDDGFSEGATRRDSEDSSSPTSAIEAQFLQLQLSEDVVSKCASAPRVQPEGIGDTPETHHKLLRQRFTAIKKKPSSLRKSPGVPLHMKEQNRSLDSQTDPASSCGMVDLNALLERDFSVQSLTSVVNEDCFFDSAESCTTNSGKVTSS
uniref:T-cell lymphoma invasion and metastasis 2 n=1 Tax=Nothobranchius kuhntae TaxID=321403 RepID=A0A1A8J3A8_NOTKU